MGIIGEFKKNKRFFEYIEENGYVPETGEDGNLRVVIWIDDIEMNLPYKLCDPYIINGWNVTFAIIYDEYGRRVLIKEREENQEDPEVILFEGNMVEIGDVAFKKKRGRLRISIESEK